MAECFDEFDAPSPMPKRYCSRMTLEEYDRIGNSTTESALQQLIDYLEYNPTSFYKILAKKRQEEFEHSSMFALVKAKLSEWYFGSSRSQELNIDETKGKLREMKENLIRSYNYAQEAKGSQRRFSQRLAQKRWRSVNANKENDKPIEMLSKKSIPRTTFVNTKNFPVPPTHRVPTLSSPSPLSATRTTIISTTANVPLPPPPPAPPAPSMRQINIPNISSKKEKPTPKTISGTKRRSKSIEKKHTDEPDFMKLMDAIKNAGTTVALKKISKSRGNLITPPRKTAKTEDQCNMFNVELLKKFKNSQSSPFSSPISETQTYFSP